MEQRIVTTRFDHLVDVEKGIISREVFVSDDVYKTELERIFARTWLFVAHAAQIPNAGDFITSRMGEESVIVCRDRRQKLHVFLNTCRHRGMKVCRYDEGNTPVFTCPYHAWSYSLTGELVGVPGYQSYYEGVLDRSQWGLPEAQIGVYKGTIWATWAADAPPLLEFLGGIRPYLDDALDNRDGSEGDAEVLCGVQKWTIPANWKFGVENFLGDTYHGNSTHRSVELIGIGPSGRSGVKGRRNNLGGAARKRFFANYPEGHGTWGYVQAEGATFNERLMDSPATEEYFRRSYAERHRRHGDRARWGAVTGSIFPNVSFHTEQPRALFVWHPNGPTSTEIWKIFLVDRDAPQEVKSFLRQFYLRYAGPAGMTEQDDMENWNYATAASRGTIARRYPYNYQLSLHGIEGDEGDQESEVNQRNFFREWARCMQNPPPQHA